jgi:uncharacterized protein (DUF1800 family)
MKHHATAIKKTASWLVVALLVCAGSVQAPVQAQVPAAALGEVQARFLLLRTGFAPTQAEVAQIAPLTAALAVDKLLAETSTEARSAPPKFITEPIIPYRSLMTDDAKKAEREQQARYGLELRSWWLREMIETPTPLSERMALFWHGHFATSQQKIRYSQPMYQQHVLIRQHALGSFADLLRGIARDPAMLAYLDGANNRKEAPNENFAREVMELFTLGEGQYTEADVKEAARAFTGWGIERDTYSFVLRPALHDTGDKTVLGKRGNFNGDDVLNILLAQNATARFITTKLMQEFVTPNPAPADVAALAAQFRAGNYAIKPLLRAMFLSPAFWSEANRGTLVKSPVELMAGAMRQFQFGYSDALPLALRTAGLGQNVFSPPNVKGWPGGVAWINSTSLLERKRFLEQLFRAVEAPAPSGKPALGMAARSPEGMNGMNGMNVEGMQDMRALAKSSLAGSMRALGREGILRTAQAQTSIWFDAEAWLARHGASMDREPTLAQRQVLQHSVLALEPVNPITPGMVGIAVLRSLVLDPTYQLK